MAFLVSPGVEVKEIDLSNFIPALSTSIGGYAGYFNWGPHDNTVLVTDEGELGRIYGVPNSDGDLTESSFFTAASFLRYSNALQVSRALPADANNSYVNTDSAATLAEFEGDQISSIDQLEASGNAGLIYGRYPGSKANGLEVWFIDKKQFDAGIPAEIRAALSHVPSITEWAEDIVGDVTPAIYDEVHVVVIDALGKFTGNIGEILEIHSGLSYASNAKTQQYGESNNYIKVVNDRSRYIWIGASPNPQEITAETTELIGPYDTEVTQSFTLGEGNIGTLTSASPIITALELFEDDTQIDINLLFAQNFIEDASPGAFYTQTEQYQIDQEISRITLERRDLVGFVSAPIGLKNLSTNNLKLQSVLDKFEWVSSNNYLIFDSGPAYVYNKYRDGYVWIPLCGHMAGLCARTDDLTDPWFSPAGLNRGGLSGITKLAFNPNQVQRDELYKNRVNPVVSYPGQGIVLYGDKTGQSKPSAFDRINVRRLFITIEKAIATASKFQLFEFNDEFTRLSFVNAITPYLRDVQGRRGIIDFRVVCDDSNNTPEVIDSNRFVADIYIKPNKSINFITLNFIATRTSASFEELVGR